MNERRPESLEPLQETIVHKSPDYVIPAQKFANAFSVKRWSAVAAAVLMLGSSGAPAQGWPVKAVTLVVPTSAGSAPDTYARALADQLIKSTGATFIVENNAAVAGNVAAESVGRKPADGQTFLIGTQALMTINQSTYPQVRWQSKDFRGVAKGVEAPLVLVVHPSISVKNFAGLQAWGQKEHGTAAYASFSAGTPSHFLGHQLSEKLKLDMVHVPYKSSASQINDLLGGQVKLGFTQLATALPHINAGKLNAIAQTGHKRSKLLPQVPTLAELGHSDLTSAVWFGVVIRSGTPQPMFDQILAAVEKVHTDTGFRAKLEAQGFEMAQNEIGSVFDKAMVDESARWARVVKATGFNAVE